MTPNPNPSPELPNCDLSSCPCCGALPVDWADDPFKAVSDTARIDDAVERMRADPFADDIPLLGTTQQDERMRHYAIAALTPPTPAETVTVALPGAGEMERKVLVDRLRAHVDSGLRTIGGGTVSYDGKSSTWGNEPIMRLANPDGPAAADMIEALATVAAANDEGVAEAAIDVRKLVTDALYDHQLGNRAGIRDRLIADVSTALATSRSQHEGAGR